MENWRVVGLGTKEQIKNEARRLGFDLCGITSAEPPPHAGVFQQWVEAGNHGEMGYMARRIERRTDLQNVLPGVKSVIVAGMNYCPSESRGRSNAARPPHGVIARYARGRDYHEIMGKQLGELTNFIRTLPHAGTQSVWYVDTGPVLERDLAQRAGVGWIGKHTNLINRSLGNWFFLGEILTTLELVPDPPQPEHCGTCTRCIAACPTQAIRAPYTLDARRCISYLTIELKGSIPAEFRSLIGNRIFGCDDCLAVCPWNRFAQTANALQEAGFENMPANGMTDPDLIELMALSEEQFRIRFRGTPVIRIKRRGLLRNVAVALGNSGDRRAVPVLQKALDDPEPLVREHAEWAIQRISEVSHPNRAKSL